MASCCTERMVAVATELTAADLERLLRLIEDAGINLDAYAGDEAGLRLFCTEPEQLKQVIMDAGMFCQIVDVLSLDVDNKPGQVRRAMEALEKADVQVISLFGMGVGESGRIFIRVGDVEKAMEAIQNL